MEIHEPIHYNLKHKNGIVDLVLSNERLVVSTQGVGLIDKLRSHEIPIRDIKNFCVVPTIGAQNIISRRGGESGEALYDCSYDAEFIFSYEANGKLKKKRVFVNTQNDVFQSFLEPLVRLRPDASLLHVPPAEAQRQIGVMAARKAVLIVFGLLVGVPVLIAMIVIISQILNGHKH